MRPVENTLAAVFEGGSSEVDEQAKREPEQSEVGEDLLGMNGEHVLHRLQFNQETVFNDDVRTEAFLKSHAHQPDGNGNLPFHHQTLLGQHPG